MPWFSSAPSFTFNGGYVVVDDVAAAAKWYTHVFGGRAQPVQDEETGSVLFKCSEEDPGIALIGPPKPGGPEEPPPIVNTNSVTKAHDLLEKRGAFVGPVQQDVQGTRFFEIRDCCGNVLEISKEP